MAGFKVVPIKALSDGSLDLEDLSTKAEQYKDTLGAFMVGIYITSFITLCLIHSCSQITYPSTFGVFEDGVQKV